MTSTGRLLALAAAVAGCAAEAPPAVNFVVVDIDTLRADRLDAKHGEAWVMPNLRALADRGVRFDTMVSQSGWTMPALEALLTGKVPRMPPAGRRPGEQRRTVGDVLGYYGYRTYALWGEGPARIDKGEPYRFDAASTLAHHDLGPSSLLAQVETWLATPPREPFFLFVHHFDAHVPGPEFTRAAAHRYVADETVLCPRLGYDETLERIRPRVGEEAARAHVLAHYDGVLSAYDEVFGRILDAFDREGISGRTWFVVTSNHGQDFFSHQAGVAHGALYDDLVRVPLVVAGPGVVRPGRAVETMVQTVDVAPTLLELAGVPADHEMEGASLGPWIRGEGATDPDRVVFSITNRNNMSVRTAGRKLMQRTAGSDWKPGGPQKRPDAAAPPEVWMEYYDLVADPDEKTDLWPTRAEEAADLRAALDAWRDRVAGGAPGQGWDEDAKEALRRQGYWGIAGEEDAARP